MPESQSLPLLSEKDALALMRAGLVLFWNASGILVAAILLRLIYAVFPKRS